jgi:hypothetical protein
MPEEKHGREKSAAYAACRGARCGSFVRKSKNLQIVKKSRVKKWQIMKKSRVKKRQITEKSRVKNVISGSSGGRRTENLHVRISYTDIIFDENIICKI